MKLMKIKTISAIVAIAIVIPLLIIGGLPLYIGIGALAVLAYKEIVTLKEAHQKLPDLIKVFGAFGVLYITYSRMLDEYAFITGISYPSLAALLLVMLIPTLFYKDSEYTTKDALYMSGAIVMIGLIFNSLILVYSLEKLYLVYLILITTMNDTFAMIVGNLIGKHKLIPRVSPNKSIEGSIGGLIVGTFIATVFHINIINSSLNIFVLILITIALGVIGQIGDLVFSKIKRENNIKDFSNIMPGHGGILDRIDSLALVLFAFLVIFNYL